MISLYNAEIFAQDPPSYLFLETFDSQPEQILFEKNYTWDRGMEPEQHYFIKQLYPPICDNYCFGRANLYTRTSVDTWWHLEGYFTAMSKLAIQAGKLYSKQYINDNGKGEYWHGLFNSGSANHGLNILGGDGKVNHLTRVSADFGLIGAHVYGENIYRPWATLRCTLLLIKDFQPRGYTIGEWRTLRGEEGLFPVEEKYPPLENYDANLKEIIAPEMSNEEFDLTFGTSTVGGVVISIGNIDFRQGWDCFGEGNEIYLELTIDNIKVYQPVEHKLSISQAKTDKEKYSLNEQVKISCVVLDEDGIKVSDANVTAEIEIPDGTKETIVLWETEAGEYEGIFTSTPLAGKYNITIKAEKQGYAGDAAQLSFIIPVEIILTFDDGPVGDKSLGTGENSTENILNDLSINDVQNHIKTTFFVQTHDPEYGGSPIGESLIIREDDEDHVVGIHTGGEGRHFPWTDHIDRVEQNDPEEDIYDANEDRVIDEQDGRNALECDLVAAKKRIYELTERIPEFVRPPYWRYNDEVLATYQRQDLKMILTDAKGGDGGLWYMNIPSKVSDNLTNTVQACIEQEMNQIVITLHDTNTRTAEYLNASGIDHPSYLDSIVEGVRRGLELETREEALEHIRFITSAEEMRQILESR